MFLSSPRLWYLLAGGILLTTIQWPARRDHIITAGIPASVHPDTVMGLLHDHVALLRLNPLIVNTARVLTDPVSYDDEFLEGTDDGDEDQGQIAAYTIRSVIPIIPQMGEWARVQTEYRAWLRNTEHGLVAHARASLGTSVRSRWTVERNTTDTAKGYDGYYARRLALSVPGG